MHPVKGFVDKCTSISVSLPSILLVLILEPIKTALISNCYILVNKCCENYMVFLGKRLYICVDFINNSLFFSFFFMCQKICFQYLKYFNIYFICGEVFNQGIYIYKRVLKPVYHFLYYLSCDKKPARLICNDLGSSVVILLNDKK